MTDEWFSNNPANSVSHSSELHVSCGWSTADGYVGLVASETALGTKADLWVETADNFLYGSGSASLSRSAFDATVTSLFSPLLAGRTVVLLPEARELDELAALIASGEPLRPPGRP